MANRLYTNDYDSYYVPAAADIFSSNLRRWHGWRTDVSSSFQPEKGPLWPYFSRSKEIKMCPLVALMEGSSPNAFELSGGGYGYNATYIGGSYWKYGFSSQSARITAREAEVHNPSETVMFTDTAMPQGYPRQHIIEYSFCEPPYFVDETGVLPWHATPSIHFRHNGNTMVAWCDGHISSEKMSFTAPNVYGGDNEHFKVGWFGPDSNDLFDLN